MMIMMPIKKHPPRAMSPSPVNMITASGAARGARAPGVAYVNVSDPRSMCSTDTLQLRRRIEQLPYAVLCHDIIDLNADPRGEFGRIDPGLDREDFAFDQHIIPFRIEVRKLVRLKTDAVAEMVRHAHAGVRSEEHTS